MHILSLMDDREESSRSRLTLHVSDQDKRVLFLV